MIVLGLSGMLGHTVYRRLLRESGVAAYGLARSPSLQAPGFSSTDPRVLTGTDVRDTRRLSAWFETVRPEVVINCVGVIKQVDAVQDPVATVELNGLFPHRLAALCRQHGARLVQISTDCVFSGRRGAYEENDVPDPPDLYGRSKLVGEVYDDRCLTIRTSIIGHELATNHSLVDWFLSQRGAVSGYTRAIFSGLPTIELADVLVQHVLPRDDLSGLYHVAAEPISKFDLLDLVRTRYEWKGELHRSAAVTIDRSLVARRWREATGYVPTAWPLLIDKMFEDYMHWQVR